MGSGGVRNYTDLLVWQKAVALAKAVYSASSSFPAPERFGLTSQIRRASVSVASNIAEGHARQYDAEFRQFLHVALGSLAELDTQLTLAREFGYLRREDTDVLFDQITELRKMIYGLTSRLADQG